jgi:hypothetical protein
MDSIIGALLLEAPRQKGICDTNIVLALRYVATEVEVRQTLHRMWLTGAARRLYRGNKLLYFARTSERWKVFWGATNHARSGGGAAGPTA